MSQEEPWRGKYLICYGRSQEHSTAKSISFQQNRSVSVLYDSQLQEINRKTKRSKIRNHDLIGHC